MRAVSYVSLDTVSKILPNPVSILRGGQHFCKRCNALQSAAGDFGFERPSVSNSSDSIDRLRRMSYRCNIRAYCIQYVELRLVCVRAYYICVYDDTDEETC